MEAGFALGPTPMTGFKDFYQYASTTRVIAGRDIRNADLHVQNIEPDDLTLIQAGPCHVAQLKTPEGKLIDLPKGAPVDVPVTVPASGELGFACGMDMFRGKVVADKS